MSVPLRGRLRALPAAAGLVALIALTGLATGALSATDAAWTDRTVVAAGVSSGSWQAPVTVGCTAMTAAGQPLAGGSCTVASIRYEEWGSPGSRMRGYYVALSSNAGNGFIRFTIDLSAASGPSSDFSWSRAGLTNNAQAIPVRGWSCNQLPVLTADTPSNWGWNASSSIYFQVSETRSGSGTSCS